MVKIRFPKVILLFDDISHAYEHRFLRGVTNYSSQQGPWVFYGELGSKRRILPLLDIQNADGAIARVVDPKKAKEIIDSGVPAIVLPVKKGIPGLSCTISSYSAEIGKMAAEYFLNRGFKNFAFCGYSDRSWSKERYESFSETVSEAGFETCFYAQLRPKGPRTCEKQQLLIADWLNSLPKPVAVMACNDERGQHVTRACQISGLKVPNEIAVLGVDNDEVFCRLCTPQLSSIATAVERGGFEAAKTLDRLMSGEKITEQRILIQPTHVVERQSTSTMPVNDTEVVKALQFIHKNFDRLIQVSDVVGAVSISRRSLEMRFNKTLLRSVHDEIKRVHVECFLKMLVETDWSLTKIASFLGHPDIDNLSRYFKEQMGMSPTAYRKLHILKP